MTPVQFFKCLSDETRLRCMMLLHREGQWVYYQINHELPRWAREILNTVIAATKKEERYRQDYERCRQ